MIRRTKRWAFCSLLCSLLWLSLPLYAQQDAAPNELTLEELSLSIKEKLITLKVNSEVVTEQLRTQSEALKLSKEEAVKWETTSTKLSNSLKSINDEYNTLLIDYEKAKAKLETHTKINIALTLLIVLRFIAMVFGYVLYAKGVKLPRWLDILL